MRFLLLRSNNQLFSLFPQTPHVGVRGFHDVPGKDGAENWATTCYSNNVDSLTSDEIAQLKGLLLE